MRMKNYNKIEEDHVTVMTITTKETKMAIPSKKIMEMCQKVL